MITSAMVSLDASGTGYQITMNAFGGHYRCDTGALRGRDQKAKSSDGELFSEADKLDNLDIMLLYPF